MKIGDKVHFYLPKQFFDSDWVEGEARFGNTVITFSDFMVIRSLIGFEKTLKVVGISEEGVTLEGLEGLWPHELLVIHSSKEVK